MALLAGTQLVASGEEPRAGLPWDWSHRHVIYNPETAEEAIANGRYDEWLKKSADPRFLAQLIRKQDARMDAQAAIDKAAVGVTKAGAAKPVSFERTAPQKPANPWGTKGTAHRDWANVMGGASGVGTKGTFPAKYSFDINASPSCTNDFIVYTTNSAGVVPPGGGALATRNGTMTAADAGAGTVTITNGTLVLTLTASTTLNTGLNFQAATGASAATKAANLAAAINRNGGSVGVTSSSSGATVTVTAITKSSTGNNIALAEGINGFSWAGTTLAGGGGTASQPTIFALNQLYSSCNNTAGSTQPVPATYWSYVTAANAIVSLSPVLSLDGKQVAFIEINGTTASLVLLKWSSTASVGTLGVPTQPTTAASAAAYTTCTAPCMFKISLGANDTRSSPYYDYTGDQLWVGTDDGKLHRFTGVFKGTVAQSGSPWPVTVATNMLLSPPVYDSTTQLVYVGSARGDATTTGGHLHSVSSTGTLVSSGELAGDPEQGQPAGSAGVADAPIIDTWAQRIYTFVGTDNSTLCGTDLVQCAAVYQFPSNASINGLTSPVVRVGRGQFYDRILYSGAFDNAYWSSSTPSSPSGALYVCGSLADGSSSRLNTLWKIPITNNVMGTPVAGPQLVNDITLECSPITEVANGTHDYFYTSVPANGSLAGCTGSCVYMFDLAGATWSTSLAPTAGLPAPGGSSGIIIDNVSSTTGAAQVYYSTLTSPGVAVQASQAGLN